ncbi:hypothetical protein FSP39_010205 [Pinctada imbricata]|uniref:PHD-type domain-containing protein n=1 Tax=Pinctada imbricata TaxID=66713 RepID=A0AA88YCQ9_PINIB|nr:hypothetical protein FSP39_010205 [Pinctada imbricata]
MNTCIFITVIIALLRSDARTSNPHYNFHSHDPLEKKWEKLCNTIYNGKIQHGYLVQKETINCTTVLLNLAVSILVNSNDIQPNPGPGNSSTLYPCGTCDQPVTWDDRGIVCDTCNQWYHTQCQAVNTNTYTELANDSAIAWDCIVCNNPNYTTILNTQFRSVFSEKVVISKDSFEKTCNMQGSYPTAEDIHVTQKGVHKLLTKLGPHKAAGPDEIKPRVLKELADCIAPILTIIFNRSLDRGEVPSDWRNARVTPIYKKGDRYKAENYRPISLTCICCKLLEHIVTSDIMKHADTFNIMYPLQHGFRQRRSCETQLIEFIDDITVNLSEGKQTDTLIMDYSKPQPSITQIGS